MLFLQLNALNRAGHYFNLNMAFSFVSPPLAALITYTTYLYIDPNHFLDARTAFVTLIFLFSMRHSLYLLPMSASLTVQVLRVKRHTQKLSGLEGDNLLIM